MRSFKEQVSRKKNKYSIRKFSIGIASILVGSVLFYGSNQETQASEQNDTGTNSKGITGNVSSDDVIQSKEVTSEQNNDVSLQDTKSNTLQNNQPSLVNNNTQQNQQLQSINQNGINNHSMSEQSKETQRSKNKVSTLQTDNDTNTTRDNTNGVHSQTTNKNVNAINSSTSIQQQEKNHKTVKDEKQKIYPAQVIRKTVDAQTKDVDVLKIVEKHKKYLSDEERKLFLRMVSRNSSFLARDWNHIYRSDYDVISKNVNTRVLGPNKVNNVNEILKSMYDLIENRNNDYFYNELTNDNNVIPLHNQYRLDKNIQREQDQQIIKLAVTKNSRKVSEYRGGRWIPWYVRYEQWGLRTNESLQKKIDKVVAQYHWKGKDYTELLTRDDKGFYWFKEDEQFDVGKAHAGGGMNFLIKFKKDAVLDKLKDLAWGYVISDSKDYSTLVGANVGFKKFNFGEHNLDKRFNDNALNFLKARLTNKLNTPDSTFAVSGSNKPHYLALLNKATENVTNSSDYKRAVSALNELEVRLDVAEREIKPITTVTRPQISTDTNVVDVFKYINDNAQHLLDEERKLFLRTATRYTSLKAQDWDKVYNKTYDNLSGDANTRKLTDEQVTDINKTLNALYELIQSRNNNNFYKELTNDSKTGRLHNHFAIDNNIKQLEGHQAINLTFSKNMIQLSEYSGGKWQPSNIRYEQWGVRTNESLNNKIDQVVVKYQLNGTEQEEVLTRNDKGFYWFKEDEKFAVNKSYVGGSLIVQIKFKKGVVLDKDKDVAWGYIISDSKDLETVTGANIGFKKLTFNNIESNFNQQAISNLKQALVDHINSQVDDLSEAQSGVQAFVNQVNTINTNAITPDAIDSIKQQLNTIRQNVAQEVVKVELQKSILKVPSNNQHLRLFAQKNNDVNFHSFQSKNTNPANSINADGSLTIKPKGYFIYNFNAVEKLAPGQRINLKVMADKIDDSTKFEYSIQRKDNVYLVVVTDIPKTGDGVYELKNFIIPKDTTKISLRLDNRTGTSDAHIKSFSVTALHQNTPNDLFTNNLIVTPTSHQHLRKFAKQTNDKYFHSFQSLKTQSKNTINPDGSLGVQPKGYFFYNLKATDKLAPGQTFKVQIDGNQIDSNTKFEYGFYDAQNKLLGRLTNISKNVDGSYKLDNITVPEHTTRIAIRVDNRKGTTDTQLTGLYVVPVKKD